MSRLLIQTGEGPSYSANGMPRPENAGYRVVLVVVESCTQTDNARPRLFCECAAVKLAECSDAASKNAPGMLHLFFDVGWGCHGPRLLLRPAWRWASDRQMGMSVARPHFHPSYPVYTAAVRWTD